MSSKKIGVIKEDFFSNFGKKVVKGIVLGLASKKIKNIYVPENERGYELQKSIEKIGTGINSLGKFLEENPDINNFLEKRLREKGLL